MKKRLFFTIAAISCFIACAVLFVACGATGGNNDNTGGNGGNGGNGGGGVPGHTHEYTDVVVEPDCTKGGYTEHTCICGDSYKDGYVDALGHDIVVDKGFAATCEKDGMSDGSHCGRCGEVFKEKSVIELLGHDLKYEKTANGHSVSCARCSKKFDDESHDWKDNECIECKFTDCEGSTRGMIYRLSDDKSFYILTGLGDCKETDIVVPERYNGLPVYEISSKGYGNGNFDGIESLVIPDTVKTVGDIFYGNDTLEKVVIGKGVEKIYGGFTDCYNLREIVYNAVNCKCFMYKGSTELYSVCSWAGIFTDGVTVRIGADVRHIPDRIFASGADVLGMPDRDYVSNVKHVIFDENSVCESIGARAFESNASLLDIDIPRSVKSIGANAFYNCRSFVSIVIPDTVEEVGEGVFYGCDKITVYCEATKKPELWNANWGAGAYLPAPTTVWGCADNDIAEDGNIYITAGGFLYKLENGKATVTGRTLNNTAPNIPASVTYKGKAYDVTAIGSHAFFNGDISSVTIPNTVEFLGKRAFGDCAKLTGIIMPNSVKSID